MKPRYLIVDGCPVPYYVAAQVYLVARKAGQTVNSAYRGEDAKALLHAHGKHTQREVHEMFPTTSNPENRSTHELRSDGVAWPGPVGRVLEAWKIGIDSGGNDQASKAAIERAARHYGWLVRHPYSRGVEGHHWNWAREPRARNLVMRARLIHLRAILPRR